MLDKLGPMSDDKKHFHIKEYTKVVIDEPFNVIFKFSMSNDIEQSN